MIQLTGCMSLGRTDRMVCNSNNFSVVLTLRSMIFDHCSFHEDNSFCIYCLTKMTIPKVANRLHDWLPKIHKTCLDEIRHGSTFWADVISSFLSYSVIAFSKLITQADENKRWKGWTSWSSIILWQWLFRNRWFFELTIPTALNFRLKT